MKYEDVCPSSTSSISDAKEVEYWLWGLFVIVIAIILIIKLKSR